MPVLQPEIECASRDYLHAVQSARLIRMVKNAYEHVPFYKKKLDAIGLKPEQQQRTGDLIINKTLKNQNTTFGDKATFVFQIDITNGDKKESKVEALTFDKVGDQSVHLTGLPAGAVVKVTEVYSGASYDLKSDNGVETEIKANDEYSQADAPVAEGSFVNDVNDSTNGGYGVINHFELNDKGLYDIAEVR